LFVALLTSCSFRSGNLLCMVMEVSFKMVVWDWWWVFYNKYEAFLDECFRVVRAGGECWVFFLVFFTKNIKITKCKKLFRILRSENHG
jgi:ubiquinone/menaquinone biosynthesis C-methylase UbiE